MFMLIAMVLVIVVTIGLAIIWRRNLWVPLFIILVTAALVHG